MTMLEDLPRHAGYVIASYALVGFAIAGLMVWLFHARRVQTRMLERLERRESGPTNAPIES